MRAAFLLFLALGCSVDTTGILPGDAATDAVVDAPIACTGDEQRPCGTDTGECSAGVERCAEGRWSGVCEGEVPPQRESCDAEMLDEDCDGEVNEDCDCRSGETRSCGPLTEDGVCEFGLEICGDDNTWGECTGAVLPSAEVCDGLDNNCDGNVDEGVSTLYYPDGDDDGFGSMMGEPMQACEQPPGFVTSMDDCDDDDGDIFPGAMEECDGVDNNCAGGIDEGFELTTWYLDTDGDDFGADGTEMMACAAPGSDYVEVGGDCDETDDKINPDEDEVCDLIDNDCNGMRDDDACDPGGGFTCDAQEFEGRLYLFCDRPRNWAQAGNTCPSLGPYRLVDIQSIEENGFIASGLGPLGADGWIGLNDLGGSNEGVFTWRSGAPLTFTRWAAGEPDDGGDCVSMESSMWNDVLCGVLQPFVCEQVD